MTTDNWPTGRVAVLMPQLPEHLATPHLLDIYAKRLRANLEGVCPEYRDGDDAEAARAPAS